MHRWPKSGEKRKGVIFQHKYIFKCNQWVLQHLLNPKWLPHSAVCGVCWPITFYWRFQHGSWHTASWNNRLWSPEHPDQPSALTSNLFRLAGEKATGKASFYWWEKPETPRSNIMLNRCNLILIFTPSVISHGFVNCPWPRFWDRGAFIHKPWHCGPRACRVCNQ